MYGHPYAKGWKDIMRAEVRRRNRRLLLSAAAISALLFPAAWSLGRVMGAW
jgi:hypothetical protein